MDIKRKIILKLDELLNRNYDAEYAYKEGAKIISDSRLTEFFETFAKKRFHFGKDLQGEILRLGGAVDPRYDMVRGLELLWRRMRSVIVTNNEQAILSECNKIEMECWLQYNRILSIRELQDKTRAILENHKANVDKALYKIIEIKDNYALY